MCRKFAGFKIMPTFAPVIENGIAIPAKLSNTTPWRGGRVVDCGGLENR